MSTDVQLDKAEAARVTRRLLPSPWSDFDDRGDAGELTEWDIKHAADRELEAALLADNLTHGHRRERMPDGVKAREDAAIADVEAIKQLQRLTRWLR